MLPILRLSSYSSEENLIRMVIKVQKIKIQIKIRLQELRKGRASCRKKRENCDSRTKVKIVKKGSSSPDVTPSFGGPTTSISETPFYQALEKLAKSANERMTLKSIDAKKGSRSLDDVDGQESDIGRIIQEQSYIGNVEIQSRHSEMDSSKSQSNLHNLLLLDPSKVEVFRKNLDRRSGKELFRPFNDHITQILENASRPHRAKLSGKTV